MNPALGAFLSRDPFEGVVGGESVRWNSYLYVHANPINLTDPSGKFIPLAAGLLFQALTSKIVIGSIIGTVTGIILNVLEQAGELRCQGITGLTDILRNLDYGRTLKNAILGGLGGGFLGVGGAITSSAILGGVGYYLGTMVFNYLEGERQSVFKGASFESLAGNVIFGGILGGVTSFVGRLNIPQGGVEFTGVASTLVPFSSMPLWYQGLFYGLTGSGVLAVQHLLTDNDPLGSKEEPIGIVAGLSNAVSVYSGLSGVLLTAMGNTLITLVGNALDQ